jgi:hypothetical protein
MTLCEDFEKDIKKLERLLKKPPEKRGTKAAELRQRMARHELACRECSAKMRKLQEQFGMI